MLSGAFDGAQDLGQSSKEAVYATYDVKEYAEYVKPNRKEDVNCHILRARFSYLLSSKSEDTFPKLIYTPTNHITPCSYVYVW
jgi:hypothetical protein